ncbi:uncharacterized protein isoform X3 [Salmo salar]|uniref:Uncharacterized protein LOC106575470 isoform X3 n=1 Tax=Salmo salar TaxID=8030 RepID=A0ABM3D895_SALSA|nr:uncharacterized protein LOC106575470 isoform X3 [Salmo salar]XP_045555013.1 uncharacterized protein LOC106575470 isoform X3 [Salmo salar]XP_045555014.1 uncharacterized protein LOC106575470 isoform X3 [Salmo salar]
MLVWKKRTGYTWIDILSKLFCGMCGTAGNNANSVKPVTKHEVGESKTDGSAAPVGADVSKTDGSAAPVGTDVSKTDDSAAPGGDLNAAEGEANGEGFVLLNEDRVKYDNGNGEGAAEENSAL